MAVATCPSPSARGTRGGARRASSPSLGAFHPMMIRNLTPLWRKMRAIVCTPSLVITPKSAPEPEPSSAPYSPLQPLTAPYSPLQALTAPYSPLTSWLQDDDDDEEEEVHAAKKKSKSKKQLPPTILLRFKFFMQAKGKKRPKERKEWLGPEQTSLVRDELDVCPPCTVSAACRHHPCATLRRAAPRPAAPRRAPPRRAAPRLAAAASCPLSSPSMRSPPTPACARALVPRAARPSLSTWWRSQRSSSSSSGHRSSPSAPSASASPACCSTA